MAVHLHIFREGGERVAHRLELDPVEHVLEEAAHDQALGLGPGAVGHELRAAPPPLLVGAPLGETGGQKLAGAQVAHGMLLIEIVVRVARHAIDELYGEGVVVNGKPAD